MRERTIRLDRPLSLRQTLAPLQHGKKDPCVRFEGSDFWRATRTPLGPATLMLRLGSGTVNARSWGPGSQWALDHVPDLIGEDQDDTSFETTHSLVRELHSRHRGLRIPRTGAVFEALLPAVLEQRVTGMEAKHSYARLVLSLGEPAPAPECGPQLLLQPPPAVLATTPSWALHRFGVDRKRAETIRRAALCAKRLEEATTMSMPEARSRLLAVPGIGLWTTAEVGMAALGNADAVSVGDYHLPNVIAWALAGEPRGDDKRMLELLEPFRGQRGRVTRLISIGHPWPPKFGPRYSPLPISSM